MHMRMVTLPVIVLSPPDDDDEFFVFDEGATEGDQIDTIFEQFGEIMADEETTPKTWEALGLYLETVDYRIRRETRDVKVAV